MSDLPLRVRVAPSLADVPAAEWDVCASSDRLQLTSAVNLSPDLSTRGIPPNPFVSHAFLSSLEQSKSVGGRSGWQPQHLLAESPDGALLGAVPCYVKSHSRGEYVFDHGWADAFERAGGDYYPK